jgi:hypothetical protein
MLPALPSGDVDPKTLSDSYDASDVAEHAVGSAFGG